MGTEYCYRCVPCCEKTEAKGREAYDGSWWNHDRCELGKGDPKAFAAAMLLGLALSNLADSWEILFGYGGGGAGGFLLAHTGDGHRLVLEDEYGFAYSKDGERLCKDGTTDHDWVPTNQDYAHHSVDRCAKCDDSRSVPPRKPR